MPNKRIDILNKLFINLSRYNLTHLDKELFSNLTQLQELCLSSNNLTHLPKNIFDKLIFIKDKKNNLKRVGV